MTLEQFIKPFLAGHNFVLRLVVGTCRRVGSVRAMQSLVFAGSLRGSAGRSSRPRRPKSAQFLGIKADEEETEKQPSPASSADTMRKLEQQQADKWTGTKNTVKEEFPSSARQKSGGWKEELGRATQSKRLKSRGSRS